MLPKGPHVTNAQGRPAHPGAGRDKARRKFNLSCCEGQLSFTSLGTEGSSQPHGAATAPRGGGHAAQRRARSGVRAAAGSPG